MGNILDLFRRKAKPSEAVQTKTYYCNTDFTGLCPTTIHDDNEPRRIVAYGRLLHINSTTESRKLDTVSEC